MGYRRAGFTEIVGIDIKPQPRYPFAFIQADALKPPVALSQFDAIHASPPCQAHTALRTSWNARKHISVVDETRALLLASHRPYVIENVPGAPLGQSIRLCGTQFGLGTADAELRRHRYFETSVPISALIQPCKHRAAVIGVYGGHGRDRRRIRTIGVYGGGHGESKRNKERGHKNFSAAEQREAMGIDWMTVDELSQAIPPAYTEWIGRQLLQAIR